MTESLELPLFPLNAVLFPQGLLKLRIFEPRYLSMVSYCLREDSGFGISLIHEGSETGGHATTSSVGTLARIVDWDRLADGVLSITVCGEQRLRLEASWAQDDGLNIAQAIPVMPEETAPVPKAWRSLLPWLHSLLSQDSSSFQWSESDFEDAGWVSYRFAECLPIPLAQKQVLLELTDPLERLRMLWAMVQAARNKPPQSDLP